MGPFDPSGSATVVVTPTNVTLRQTVTATVTTDRPIDEVRSARLDWGYSNFYQYHVAGPVDSAAAAGNDRDTDDWVSVIAEDVPIDGGEFTGTASTLRIPSWAPASSPSIARWECRLTIDRDGQERVTRGEFTVAIGTADVEAYVEPLEVVSGAAETVIELTLSAPVYRASEVITGQITLTPIIDLPSGDLAVSWQRERESHPLTLAAGPGQQSNGPIVHLGKQIALSAGVPAVFGFAIPLPADAPPTAAAVHSSINWFVQARLTYAGFDAHPLECVRRPLVVVSAP